jgi:hypothetical protein
LFGTEQGIYVQKGIGHHVEARSQVSGNADGPDRLAGNVNRSFQLLFQRVDQGFDEF